MTCTDHLGEADYFAARDTLALFSAGPLTERDTDIVCGGYGARFELRNDLSPLFPFINAEAERSQLHEKPVYIKFIFKKRLCAFYAREGAFTPVRDMGDALEFLQILFDFIRDIKKRMDRIVPSHKTFKPSSALDIYRLLPGTNCHSCGYSTCFAFAAALSRQHTSIVNCPHLSEPMEERATYPVYDGEGKVIKTVSFTVNSESLHQKISMSEARIQELQSRLVYAEKNKVASFDAANATLPQPLTKREIEVLGLIASGATNKEISGELRISQHTVKSHVIHIFNKIGVNDRVQASTWAVTHGLTVKVFPDPAKNSC